MYYYHIHRIFETNEWFGGSFVKIPEFRTFT